MHCSGARKQHTRGQESNCTADPLLGLWEGAENDLCLSQAGLVGAERVKDSVVGIQAAGSSNGGGGIRGLGQRSRKLELLLSKQCTWLVDATGGSQGGGGGCGCHPPPAFLLNISES